MEVCLWLNDGLCEFGWRELSMSKKLEGNCLWESSRLILPQHKEVILNDDLRYVKKTRPVLDEQETERIEYALIQSFRERRKVTLELFALYEQVEVTGVVTTIQTMQREIKLAISAEQFQWIKMQDILFANLT